MVETKYEYEKKPYFTIRNNGFGSVKDFKNHTRSIANILSEYGNNADFSDIEYEKICDILYHSELMGLHARKSLSDKIVPQLSIFQERGLDKKERSATLIIDEKDILKNIKQEDIAFDNYPIEMSFDGKLLTVHTPLTFKRGYKNNTIMANYTLAIYVENMIRKWENEHQFEIYNTLELPLILVMKRVQKEFSIYKVCDNDNIENQKIINSIARALGDDDNAYIMSLFSMFDTDEDEKNHGTWFYLFSERDLDKYSYLFKKQNFINNEYRTTRKITSKL